jgi:peptidoglycan/xylan/chitin deacetylase (PgdA/CDA1 family)
MPNLFIEQFAEIKSLKKATIRDISRKVVLDTLSFAFDITGTLTSLFKKPRVQFLYIHHVFEDEEALLEKLIVRLKEHHTFISYNEAVHRIWNGNVDKPYITISSDDGLKNNLRAAEILVRHGISACFFICPPMIGQNDFEKVKNFSMNRLHLPPVEFMNWNDVDKLLQLGHEIGGHSMTHTKLSNCNKDQLTDEIGSCYSEIVNRCGFVKHFAFPYGRYHHFSSAAKKIVFSTGYESCASAERGCHISPAGSSIVKESLFIRRDHILLTWPIEHILYFMARNVQKAAMQNNYSPYDENSNNNKQ